ncbi:hypothetical protein M758_7G142000 [Ceratodon purpureus]|nr:hypothetical protein M758_7G142000 [Ceratodon purpureus]
MAMASLSCPHLSAPALHLASRRRFTSLRVHLGVLTPHEKAASVSSTTRAGGSAFRFAVRAVSVSGDTEQKESDVKEADVKKRTAYRPIVILPGLGNNTGDYNELVASLAARGLTAVTAKVSRPDWLRNASGILDASYWKGTLQPRPTLDWYLERIKNAIQEAKAMAPESGKVTIVAHSAGGWLGRVYMADFGTEDVALFLSLGSPHLPPPRNVPGVVDQTRGLLYYVEENIPGAFHAPDVKYVCIAGRYLKGDRFFPGNAATVAPTGLGTVDTEVGSAAVSAAEEGKLEAGVGEVIEDGDVKPAPPTLRARIVGQGYKQVCGQADVWGDGVVPEVSAHLEGAENLTFEGVYHSPVGASDERPWYGTSKILDQWVHYLME